ncbi:MAG: hypothetical protein ACREOE_16560, partial [Gemmatimonadales bacterium]
MPGGLSRIRPGAEALFARDRPGAAARDPAGGSGAPESPGPEPGTVPLMCGPWTTAGTACWPARRAAARSDQR